MIGKAAPRLLATAVLLAATLAPAPAVAQDEPDTGAISAFVDRAFGAAVEAGDLRGAVVAVVRGGDLLHLVGYGVADEAGTPMRADDTGIRLGSASHVLTALVALAAAEEGIVGLQDDVRERLRGAGIDFEIARPLTLHQLLTHTSGLGARRLGQYRPEADRGSLAALIAGRPPPVQLGGGQAVIESGLAMALAGAVLELASGEPLPALADRLLFRPAGLERTSFVAPNTADGPAAWAMGYRWAGQRLRPMSSDEVPSTLAWEAAGTAADIALLLAALLGDGASATDPAGFPGQARELLTTRQATTYRAARGRSVALAERVVAGRTTWSHDGAAPGFTTHLAVVPDLDLGIFVAANSGATTGLWLPSATSRVVQRFPEALLRALWPDAVAPATELEVLAPDDRADYGGVYRDARIDPDTPLKVRGLIEQEPVAMLSDVRLRFRGQTYRKIALDTFQSEDEPARFTRFLRDDSGAVSHLLTSDGTFERVRAWEWARVQILLAGLALGLIALGTILVVMAVARRWPGLLANTFGLVAGVGGLALAAWFGWRIAAFSMDVVLARGMTGLPYPTPVWIALAAAAALSFLLALFGRGIRGWNRWGLIFVAAGWVVYAPVLLTWRLLA